MLRQRGSGGAGRVCEAVAKAVRTHREPWARRAAAAVAEIFAVFAEDETLAWLCVIEPLHGSDRALAARRAASDRLTTMVGEPPRQHHGTPTSPLLLAPLWGMVQQHLLDAIPLEEAVSSAIYLTLVPVVGRADALHEARAAVPQLRCRRPRQRVGQALGPGIDLAARDVDALLHLHRSPGASNAEIARAIGDRHESQISRRMAGLRKAGLVRRKANGRHAAWQLTPKGREIVTQLEPEER